MPISQKRREAVMAYLKMEGGGLSDAVISRITGVSVETVARIRLEETATTLYRCYDAEGDLLYVGISIDAIKRSGEHYQARWYKQVATITLVHLSSRQAALEAERLAIQMERPKHNITHNRPDQPKRKVNWKSRRVSAKINKRFRPLILGFLEAGLFDQSSDETLDLVEKFLQNSTGYHRMRLYGHLKDVLPENRVLEMRRCVFAEQNEEEDT